MTKTVMSSQTQLNLSVVALVALVAIVGFVALVLIAATFDTITPIVEQAALIN